MFHVDLKTVDIFGLGLNSMLIEENEYFYFFFIDDAGWYNSVQDVSGTVQQNGQ